MSRTVGDFGCSLIFSHHVRLQGTGQTSYCVEHFLYHTTSRQERRCTLLRSSSCCSSESDSWSDMFINAGREGNWGGDGVGAENCYGRPAGVIILFFKSALPTEMKSWPMQFLQQPNLYGLASPFVEVLYCCYFRSICCICVTVS